VDFGDPAFKDQIISMSDYVSNLKSSLVFAWEHASSNITDAAQSYNVVPVEPRTFEDFHVGDWFYYKILLRKKFKNPKATEQYLLSRKLDATYTGPFVILKVISPVTYVALMYGHERVIHAIHMKRR